MDNYKNPSIHAPNWLNTTTMQSGEATCMQKRIGLHTECAILTLLVTRLEYCSRNMSKAWLLISWLVVMLGYQQPWHYTYKIINIPFIEGNLQYVYASFNTATPITLGDKCHS